MKDILAGSSKDKVSEERLRITGICRDAQCATSLALFFNRVPTDEEMRAVHESFHQTQVPHTAWADERKADNLTIQPRADLLQLLRFRILDSRNCDMESMTALMGEAADEIEQLQKRVVEIDCRGHKP